MNQIKLSFVELHTALFFQGINFGLKLELTKRTGLELTYLRDKSELIVQYSGKACIVPISNVASMSPINSSDLFAGHMEEVMVQTEKGDMILAKSLSAPTYEASAVVVKSKNLPKPIVTTAQVDSPQAHVHAGIGHGKN